MYKGLYQNHRIVGGMPRYAKFSLFLHYMPKFILTGIFSAYSLYLFEISFTEKSTTYFCAIANKLNSKRFACKMHSLYQIKTFTVYTCISCNKYMFKKTPHYSLSTSEMLFYSQTAHESAKQYMW